MKYLITHTLLSSHIWTCKIGTKEKVEELKKMINKESMEPNKAMKNGLDFEALVKAYTEDRIIDHMSTMEKTAKIIAHIVRGGTWQVKGQKNISIADNEYLLYGKADVLKGPVIYDIKFISSEYEMGKYQDSTQHRIYFELFPGCTTFKYLISDGYNVYIEQYINSGKYDINGYISDLMSYLKSKPELFKIFQEKWQAF